MSTNSILNRLKSYYYADLELIELTETDINFILGCIDTPDLDIRTMAATLISQLPEPVIEKILTLFPKFKKSTQKQVVIHLMTISYLSPYRFLLNYLITLDDENMVNFIITCLSKTQFELFPMILNKLGSEDMRYIGRLKQLIRQIGFNRLELYLKLMPQIPFEQYFRDVFGGDKINQLK